MPFKSKKQKTYLAINEPDVYKKFKKEETMTKKNYPSADMTKKEKEKFKKESDKRKRKKAAIKMGDIETAVERNRMIQEQARAPFKGKDRQDSLFFKGLKRTEVQRKMNKERNKPMEKKMLSEKKPKKSKSKKVMKPMPSPGLMGPTRKMGGKVTKRPMGGKVYKVDNAGQMMVQRMYGGKLGF